MELDIRDLSKSYGKVQALDQFSVTLNTGIYGILGPNGAGKSTLINILTDNVKRDSGEILWNRQEILQMGGDYRRLVGYMPQEQICYPQFTLLEFLRYMAVVKGLDIKSTQIKEQIEMLTEELHLADVLNRRLGGFSGGMKRRAVLAQALLGDPSLLILDEPTAGLDPRERIAMRNLVARIAGERIVLLATHIATDIECIADEVLLMKGGRLLRKESPFALLESVRDHVWQLPCTREELDEYQKHYRFSNCIQTHEGLVLHIIDTEQEDVSKEEYGHREAAQVTLEDVYLYYFEATEKKL